MGGIYVWVWLVGVDEKKYIDFLILLIPTLLVFVINPRRACAARVTVVVLCVCVCVCLSVCPLHFGHYE